MKITRSYKEYCGLFIEISKQLGRPLKAEEMTKKNVITHDLPNYKWFIDHCPDKSVKGFNDFLVYLGFKPRYEIPKEYAKEAILRKYKELGRPLMYDDFRNPNGVDEIGIATINKHWGTFNKMLSNLGLPINQESMMEKHKDIEELKQDIIRLCNEIKEREGRTIINQVKDIDETKGYQNRGTYHRRFKVELGLSLSEFIESIGFQSIEPGRGNIHVFPDGEVAHSDFEYSISCYLRENNIPYKRDVRYSDISPGYSGNKLCDYAISDKNGVTWYVEAAGTIDYTKMRKVNDYREMYLSRLNEKESLLKSAGALYMIVFPHDVAKRGLDDIFSNFGMETEAFTT